MTYWHMQMHPNNINWGKDNEILKENIIGIYIKSDKTAINNFKSMKKGDIVLIRRGKTPLALVEIESDEYEEYKIDNYDYYKRNVIIWKNLLENNEKRDVFSQAGGTLQKSINKNAKTYKYIDKWYKEILENEENNRIINIEDYQDDFLISIEELKKELNKTNSIRYIDILNFYKGSIKDIETIDIEIENVKNIKKLEKFRIKLNNGLYTIVGNNGIGKSALLISLGHLTNRNSLKEEFKGDAFNNSKITYIFNDIVKFVWKKYNQKDGSRSWTIQNKKFDMPKIDGFFESGIISGSRFEHLEFKKAVLDKVDKQNIIKEDSQQDKKAIYFIKKNLDYIINGEDKSSKYNSLFTYKISIEKKVKNGTIYCYKDKNGKIISEFSFSTGEYFVLALLKIIAKYRDKKKKSLIIIDELDISLHPLAQKRLIEAIKCFKDRYNITFVLATHSLQIIENLDAENIYYFENNNGNITISNPIYPAYVTKDIYKHQYYDKVLLVEDNLAKSFLEKVIKRIDRNNEFKNKLHYKIFSIGDWRKVLEVARDNKICKYYPKADIIAIPDDDVNKQANAPKWKNVKKIFIPVEDNIEKYTVTKLLECRDFKKMVESDLISPNKFSNLDTQGEEKTTSQIKNKFSKGKHSIVKQICDYSEKNENEIIEKIIEYIFQQKVESSDKKYLEFEKTLKEFFEINEKKE